MADASFAVTSFLGGEWSKYAQGRFDLPEYRKALNVCLNSLPLEQGALTRRPGTMYAQTTRGGQPGMIRPFDFKRAQPYSIEFTAGYLRFRNGPTLVTTNDDKVISSISSASPAEVTTSASHGWSSGDSVQFANCAGLTPLLQNRVFTIASTGANKFTITDSITGDTIDGSTLGMLNAATTVQRILEIASPYNDAIWADIRVIQAELSAVLLHPDIPPYVLTAVAPGAGQIYYGFTLTKANLIDGPYLDQFTNGVQVTPSATQGLVTLTLSFPTYSATKAYSIGDFVTLTAVNYRSLVDQNVGNQPDTHPTQWAAVSAGLAIGPNGFVGTDIGRLVRIQDSASNWTWGKITALANLISGTLAGSVNIGSMTGGGGLTAAFDSVTAKAATACASVSFGSVASPSGYVGKNYSGASAKAISIATVWPSTDLGFYRISKNYSTTTTVFVLQNGVYVIQSQSGQVYNVFTTATSTVANLRAKATAPSSSSDGTLLGSAAISGTSPITITSNDSSTTWNYVWIEVVISGIDLSVPPPTSTFFPGAFSYSTTSSALNSWGTTEYIAQIQFFSPPGSSVASSVTCQILGNALADTSARANWRLGLYSDTTSWPTCGTYHEGRIWLAGAQANRFDSSNSNTPFNFAPTAATGQVLDSSSISYVFNATDVNPIFWLAPDQLGIVAGTQAGGWLVQASNNNNILTPTSAQAHRYDRIGYANIEPRRADRTLIIVQRYGRKIYEYFADVFSGKFSAANVTLTARHLTKPGISEIAYQQELTPIIWARCADGSFFGITYKRDSLVSSQPPNFQAPHRHTLGSGRVVESITVGASTDGATDALTMITNDLGTGVRHVEILTPLFEEGSAITSAWFLDDAIVPTSTNITSSDCVLNGLWPLNNDIVTVFAGGLDCGDWIVNDGSIVMTYGDGINSGTGRGLFTQSFAESASFLVGFTYNSDGQIVRPISPQETGARTGPALGKKRRAHKYAVLLNQAIGISFGTDFSSIWSANFKQPNNADYTYGQPFSGVYWDTLRDDYSFDGMICWRISRPWPATVVAIEPFLQTQD